MNTFATGGGCEAQYGEIGGTRGVSLESDQEDISTSSSTDDDQGGELQRFSSEVVDKFETSAQGRGLIRCCFLFALFYMWPYQTFVQTQNFLVEEFPDKSDSAGFVMMLFCTIPLFITHALLSVTGMSRRLSYSAKVAIPSILIACIAIYLLAALCLSADEGLLLNSLFIAALLGSISQSFVEPAVYDMAGLFPSQLTSQMLQAGNGACGLIVSLVQMGTRLAFNGFGEISKTQLDTLTKVFIALMGISSLAIVCLYQLYVKRTVYYDEYVAREGDSNAFASRSETETDGVLGASVKAIRHVWPSFLAITLTFWTTLTLWPVIPGRTCAAPPAGEGLLQSWWFDIVILIFNLSDFLGRSAKTSLKSGARALTPKVQLALAIARLFVFAPVILSSSAPQMYDATVARWVVILATFFLGLSNGWLSTVSFMRAPKALPPGTSNMIAEQASTVLVAGLYLGISGGCFTSYLLGKTVLHDVLGVCYSPAT